MDTHAQYVSLNLPVDEAACFTDHKGVHSAKTQTHQEKFLIKAAALLKTVLRPDEKVLLISPACSPMGVLEQLTTGWIIVYIKRCLLVVTTSRILHLPAKSDFSTRQSVAEISLGDIVQAKVASFLGRALTLKYRNGKTEKFVYVDGKVVRKLKQILPGLTGKGEQSTTGGRRHICPRCAQPLEPRHYACRQCFLEFKDRSRAIKYSILYPGGGYFYTGHPVLGILDALAEAFLTLLVLVNLLVVVSGATGKDEAVAGLAAFLVILVIEKLITIYHASHYVDEYIPAKFDFAPVDRR